MTRGGRNLSIVAVLLATSFLTQPVIADSVYLKNGRVIHASRAQIEGDRVVIVMYGSTQIIPLSQVDRIEKNDEIEPERSASRVEAAGQTTDSRSSTASPAPPTGALAGSPEERMQALSDMLVQSGADPAQAARALQLLQMLGGSSGGVGAADLNAQLGALGGAAGQDLEQVQALLPLLSQLGAALFAPEYSPEASAAAAQNLLSGLRSLGVSEAEIAAQAQSLGLPAELLQQLRSR